MSLRIMATADIHLGMKFASYRSLQDELVEARFTSLQRIVDEANRQACNLLVVAGDLFHRVGVAASDVTRAAEILNSFGGEAVAVLPGNHDYYTSEQERPWKQFLEASGDRVLLLREPAPYDLRSLDINAIILAAPCDAMHGRENRLAWMKDALAPVATGAEDPAAATDDDAGDPLVIGVAHGSIDGLTLDSEGHYFPMTRSELESLPPDLWIVGHTHRQHSFPSTRLVVPGTPEPDGFDCPYEGVAGVIDLQPERYSLSPVDTGTFRFATVSLEVRRGDGIAEQISQALPADALVRLRLRGSLDPKSQQLLGEALEQAAATIPYLQVDDRDVRPLVTTDEVDRSYAEGSFAHELLTQLLKEGDEEAASLAASIVREVENGTSR